MQHSRPTVNVQVDIFAGKEHDGATPREALGLR
jgi:hypothetical protein